MMLGTREFAGGLGAMMGPFITTSVLPHITAASYVRPEPEGGQRHDADPESSLQLILRAKQGDRVAIEALWARYLPRIRQWAHGRLPRASRGVLDTNDLAQEILLRAVQHIDSFKPEHEGAFQAYLRQIMRNKVIDEVRRGERRPPGTSIPEDLPAVDPSPLEIALGQETLDRYETALQQLKPQERELIIARLELGFSAAEIAEAFGKPSSAAAHMAVSRAVLRLAEVMGRG